MIRIVLLAGALLVGMGLSSASAQLGNALGVPVVPNEVGGLERRPVGRLRESLVFRPETRRVAGRRDFRPSASVQQTPRRPSLAAHPVARVRLVARPVPVRDRAVRVAAVMVRLAPVFVRPWPAYSPVPICGSYAAPVGYNGLIYNRPLCP